MVREKIGDVRKTLFEVPAKREGQKLILFGRVESKPIACESLGGNSESPQFFHYGQKSHHMMERMGHDFTKRLGLNLGKRSEHYFVRLYRKTKTPTTFIRPEEDTVMYLRQSHQILNLKKRSIMTTHQ